MPSLKTPSKRGEGLVGILLASAMLGMAVYSTLNASNMALKLGRNASQEMSVSHWMTPYFDALINNDPQVSEVWSTVLLNTNPINNGLIRNAGSGVFWNQQPAAAIGLNPAAVARWSGAPAQSMFTQLTKIGEYDTVGTGAYFQIHGCFRAAGGNCVGNLVVNDEILFEYQVRLQRPGGQEFRVTVTSLARITLITSGRIRSFRTVSAAAGSIDLPTLCQDNSGQGLGGLWVGPPTTGTCQFHNKLAGEFSGGGVTVTATAARELNPTELGNQAVANVTSTGNVCTNPNDVIIGFLDSEPKGQLVCADRCCAPGGGGQACSALNPTFEDCLAPVPPGTCAAPLSKTCVAEPAANSGPTPGYCCKPQYDCAQFAAANFIGPPGWTECGAGNSCVDPHMSCKTINSVIAGKCCTPCPVLPGNPQQIFRDCRTGSGNECDPPWEGAAGPSADVLGCHALPAGPYKCCQDLCEQPPNHGNEENCTFVGSVFGGGLPAPGKAMADAHCAAIQAGATCEKHWLSPTRSVPFDDGTWCCESSGQPLTCETSPNIGPPWQSCPGPGLGCGGQQCQQKTTTAGNNVWCCQPGAGGGAGCCANPPGPQTCLPFECTTAGKGMGGECTVPGEFCLPLALGQQSGGGCCGNPLTNPNGGSWGGAFQCPPTATPCQPEYCPASQQHPMSVCEWCYGNCLCCESDPTPPPSSSSGGPIGPVGPSSSSSSSNSGGGGI